MEERVESEKRTLKRKHKITDEKDEEEKLRRTEKEKNRDKRRKDITNIKGVK